MDGMSDDSTDQPCIDLGARANRADHADGLVRQGMEILRQLHEQGGSVTDGMVF
jgi:hypothetical protein